MLLQVRNQLKAADPHGCWHPIVVAMAHWNEPVEPNGHDAGFGGSEIESFRLATPSKENVVSMVRQVNHAGELITWFFDRLLLEYFDSVGMTARRGEVRIRIRKR